MKKNITFVLGGGGSRGALQVGAIRALFEAGIYPNLMVGTSVGAVNATALALWGVNFEGLQRLEQAWKEVSDAQLLDPRISTLAFRAVVGRPSDRARKKVEDFFVSKGFSRDLQFHMVSGVNLALVSADIETGQPVIFGENPDDSILEGLLSSIALPPWFSPREKDGHLIVDGGALSNLPIEPALHMGATEIYAFDLDDSSAMLEETPSISHNLFKYFYAVSRRHANLEKSLAEAKGVPVHCLEFKGLATTPMWDFSSYQSLIKAGYQTAQKKMKAWDSQI